MHDYDSDEMVNQTYIPVQKVYKRTAYQIHSQNNSIDTK